MSQQDHPQELRITRPDDWHLHLRDGDALRDVIGASAAQFARAIIMPNLKPPVVDTAGALAYRQRILAALPPGAVFEPLMTLYLTDLTTPAVVREARASGVVHGLKLYPAGATTNSDAGVTDIDKVAPALEAMQQAGLVLQVHGEVTDNAIDLFDREAVFIDKVLVPLRRRFPALKVVFEHITTRQAAEYVASAEGPIGATITAHHLLYNRNAIFSGGVRPHWYCLPVLKREEHRLALVAAATSGNPRFFLGTDSAPHPQRLKEHAAGCAGCYTAPHAMELYATAFERAGALARLQGFASEFGPAFYGLPVNRGQVLLRRESWTIPERLPFAGEGIVPLASGEQLDWRLVGPAASIVPPSLPPAASCDAGAAADAGDWRGARWFAPLRPLIEAIGTPAGEHEGGHPPDWLAALNRHASRRCLLSGGAVPLRFVAQDTQDNLLGYEQRIGQLGLVSTRTGGDGAWHDWFNGLAWLAYPAIKARLNALACEVLQRDGGGPVRGNLRDASTVFDENGVLFVSSDANLAQALRQRDWTRLFVSDRHHWADRTRVLLFGHALMHKLCRPYKSICGHAWVVMADAGQLAQIDTGDWSAIDARVAGLLQEASLRTRELLPLPVLGVPGWWPANEAPAFYNDTQVFRVNRRERDTP